MYVQANTPLSIEQHCVAHCKALAIGQACQNIQEFCKLQALLQAIYAFFSRYKHYFYTMYHYKLLGQQLELTDLVKFCA